MRVLKWFTNLQYNRFDIFWVAFAVLALRDGHYLASAVAVIGGCVVSAVLEQIVKYCDEAAQ